MNPEEYSTLLPTLIPFVWPWPSSITTPYSSPSSSVPSLPRNKSSTNLVPLGYVLPSVYSHILSAPEIIRGHLVEHINVDLPVPFPSLCSILPESPPNDSSDGDPQEQQQQKSPSVPTTYTCPRAFTLFHHLPTEFERTATAQRLAEYLRAQDVFRLLRGWRDEPWPVFAPDGKTLLFSMERAAVGLLGCNRYGVHMMAYVLPPLPHSPNSHGNIEETPQEKEQKYQREREHKEKNMKIWIPRRAANKSTWPSYLDNTVAGGLATADGSDYLGCMAREADEEASLPIDYVRHAAQFVGTVSYVYLTEPDSTSGDSERYVYPECQWCYELKLPGPFQETEKTAMSSALSPEERSEKLVPRPKDGEVESFSLMSVLEVRKCLHNGEFKPNCAIVTMDFLIRHGLLDLEDDGHQAHLEMTRRMYKPLPFPGPQRDFGA